MHASRILLIKFTRFSATATIHDVFTNFPTCSATSVATAVCACEPLSNATTTTTTTTKTSANHDEKVH